MPSVIVRVVVPVGKGLKAALIEGHLKQVDEGLTHEKNVKVLAADSSGFSQFVIMIMANRMTFYQLMRIPSNRRSSSDILGDESSLSL